MMGTSWKKIFEKINKTPVEGPFATDWEAMNEKIAAQPTLSTPKKRGGLWVKTTLWTLLLALIALGIFTFEPYIVEPAATGSPEIQTTPAMNKSEKSPVSNHISNEHISTIQENAAEDHAEQNFLPGEKAEIIVTDPESEIRSQVAEKDKTTDIIETSVDFGVEETTDQFEKTTADDISRSQERQPKPELKTEMVESGSAESENKGRVVVNEDIVNENVGEDKEEEQFSDPIAIELDEKQVEDMGEIFDMEKVDLAIRDFSAALEDLHLVNRELKENFKGKQQPKPMALTEETLDLRSTGFSITGLSVGAQVLTTYNPDLNGFGGGVDIDVLRKGLLLNTGVHYYDLNIVRNFERMESKVINDTSYTTEVESHSEVRIDFVWVVLGPWQGAYVADSTLITVHDTITTVVIDSTIVNLKVREEQRISLSYIEIPLLAGHRFRFDRFAIDVMGGVAFNQLTQGNVEGTEEKNIYGMDVILQPAVRYYFLPEWSVFGRISLRSAVIANVYRSTKIYSGYQLGLSYHW